jgi:hypothetical protein
LIKLRATTPACGGKCDEMATLVVGGRSTLMRKAAPERAAFGFTNDLEYWDLGNTDLQNEVNKINILCQNPPIYR